MLARLPDTITRRVAVVLGASGSGRQLLSALQPLLGKDWEIDLQGVFIEDDELQQAATLPFSKELCRLTLSVSAIKNTRFERTMALRTRAAQRSIAGLAHRMGISHSFHTLRGSTISLLRETVGSADITIFEPPGIFAATPVAPPAYTQPSQPRIVVVIDLATGAEALTATKILARGNTHRISVLLKATSPTEFDALNRLVSDLMPGYPGSIRLLHSPDVRHLIEVTRSERADLLVLGAGDDLLKPQSLKSLLQHLHCPICMVRRW